MLFKIVKDNKPSLRQKCVPVDVPYTKEDKEFVLEMVDYLKISQDEQLKEKYKIREGVGLAAPQVGRNIRALAVHYPKYDQNDNVTYVTYALLNPKIVSNSVKKVALSNGEGCLSVDDDHQGYVYRYFKIIVKAFDAIQDKEIFITARGYDAIVLQHELDHLDGILYYDHINKKDPFYKDPNGQLI